MRDHRKNIFIHKHLIRDGYDKMLFKGVNKIFFKYQTPPLAVEAASSMKQKKRYSVVHPQLGVLHIPG